ncbi:unnamed protein product [Adineta steineri]|uniref:RING-type domain-containing protein n=1 Tax=Adineta steineri TaxID=433720 RepID=A0A813T0B0_9BILA|nr:unnamed protein product [Adineta steineri]CAF3959673.1 unnamed protein product [Adineta steineri]
MLLQCPNRVYNAWKGPFPMNVEQFRTYLDTNYNLFGYKSNFSFQWLSFQPEYIQIEFGDNFIDSHSDNSFEVTYYQIGYGRVTYTYRRVIESTIFTQYRSLYLKVGSYERSKYDVYHSYQFQSLNTNTLQCIVKQLGILPEEFSTWYEKSIFIIKIEDLYHQNPQKFTSILMLKCGVIVGYFYKPRNMDYFPSYGTGHIFTDIVRLFDSSYLHPPYFSYLFIGFFICFLLGSLFHVIHFFVIIRNRSSPEQNLLVMEQLRKSDIISVEDLDNLLMNTTYLNQHHDCLFILRDKYVVMFLIDFNENSPKILKQFYEDVPFLIIPLATITKVKLDCIVVDSKYIYFPSFIDKYYSTAADWLHKRSILLSDEYRFSCEWNQVSEQEHERQHHLRFLINEEIQYQQHTYRHDINRILERITSAPPEFIAKFRLMDPHIARNDTLLNTCSICLENFQSNRRFGIWPCPGRHKFHFDCMLSVLRAGNKCPLCRHPVEPANLPGIQTTFSLLAQRTFTTMFT